MAETRFAIAEVMCLLRPCAGQVLCPTPGPLSLRQKARTTARGKSSVQVQHGYSPVLLCGVWWVSDVLCDHVFQLLSRPLKGSPVDCWRVEAVGIGTVGLPQAVVLSHPFSKFCTEYARSFSDWWHMRKNVLPWDNWQANEPLRWVVKE